MADIAPLIISYPDFMLGQMIDPEEFDQNNSEIVNKVNETIDVVNAHTEEIAAHTEEIASVDQKADEAVLTATTLGNEAKTIANSAETKADNAVTTANMANTKADNAVSVANTANTKSDQAIGTADAASNLSNYTQIIVQDALAFLESAINRAEQAVIDAQNAVGNTEIKYDVYVIVNPDNGDGTFTYNNGKVDIIGRLTSNGYQEFELSDSYYVGFNRIEAIVNDSLNRSSASGGLLEIGNVGELSNVVQLTYPMGSGTEITFKYFTQISLGGAHAMSHNVGARDAFITMSETEPTTTYSGQMFYKVVG
ncbi:MAG TPA: hypothetical protein PKI14_09310 [Fervidobacterium sp.]|nr:hypothetical protein [Fervidobacterium sp.]